jgi:hypothetical protein
VIRPGDVRLAGHDDSTRVGGSWTARSGDVVRSGSVM